MPRRHPLHARLAPAATLALMIATAAGLAACGKVTEVASQKRVRRLSRSAPMCSGAATPLGKAVSRTALAPNTCRSAA